MAVSPCRCAKVWFIPIPLLPGTTKVCPLELGDLLIIERDRRTGVPLFTHKIEHSRRLMTTEARRPLREIDDLLSWIPDLSACLGDLQKEVG